MAAEEICEKYLQGLGSADLKEKNSKDVLRTSVARINSWIEKDYIHIRNLDDDVVIYISELTKKYGELNELPMKYLCNTCKDITQACLTVDKVSNDPELDASSPISFTQSIKLSRNSGVAVFDQPCLLPHDSSPFPTSSYDHKSFDEKGKDSSSVAAMRISRKKNSVLEVGSKPFELVTVGTALFDPSQERIVNVAYPQRGRR
jgi:hypothetical protein